MGLFPDWQAVWPSQFLRLLLLWENTRAVCCCPFLGFLRCWVAAACPRNSLHNVGSVAVECFVSAPSILLEMCLSPLDQGLLQRTSRHSSAGICLWKNQRVGICKLLEMGNTANIQIFSPLCFNVFFYFSFSLRSIRLWQDQGRGSPHRSVLT